MENFLLKNPWCRAIVPLLLMAIVSIVTNTLVVEIAQGREILWAEMPKKISFIILVLALVLSAIYQIAIYRYDNELSKGFTAKQYEAQIRNKVAENVAKRSIKLIQEGNIEQLERETETFRKLYGEGGS